jgi:hypothetical protein
VNRNGIFASSSVSSFAVSTVSEVPLPSGNHIIRVVFTYSGGAIGKSVFLIVFSWVGENERHRPAWGQPLICV